MRLAFASHTSETAMELSMKYFAPILSKWKSYNTCVLSKMYFTINVLYFLANASISMYSLHIFKCHEILFSSWFFFLNLDLEKNLRSLRLTIIFVCSYFRQSIFPADFIQIIGDWTIYLWLFCSSNFEFFGQKSKSVVLFMITSSKPVNRS